MFGTLITVVLLCNLVEIDISVEKEHVLLTQLPRY
jgi:hypothetical protein